MLILAGASSAFAADRFWVATSGGEWYDQSNWAVSLIAEPPATVPGLGDRAIFERGGSFYTVTLADHVDVQSLLVRSDFVTFDLLQRNLATTSVIHVGTVTDDIGSLTVSNGNITTPALLVGFNGGDGRCIVNDTSIMVVEGAQNQLDVVFNVGGTPLLNGGLGRVDILGSLQINDSDAHIGSRVFADGTVNVNGGSWGVDGRLVIGHNGGEGQLNVFDGGTASISELTFIGETGNSFLQETGVGRVDITNGTLNSGSTATIGSAKDAFGEVDVAGSNSAWNVNGFLFVGEFGIGNMHVRNGASAFVANDSVISIGDNEALLNIANGGSVQNDGSMYVGGTSSGPGGPGHLLVQDNAELAVGGLLKIWDTATLTLEDADITAGSLMIQPGADVNFDSGTLTVNSGSFNVPVTFNFGGTNPFDPPQILLLNGALGSFTDFSLGTTPGMFAAVDVDGSVLDASDDINIGGNDSQSLGGGRLTLTGGFADAGDEVRIWDDGKFDISSGRVTARKVSIHGGSLDVSGFGSNLYVDASSDFPVGISGIHVGFAPALSELTMDGGGDLNATGVNFTVGTDTGSFAFATVTGSGSSLTTGESHIGNIGDGTLNVLDSAKATFTDDLVIAFSPGSLGTLFVEDADSMVTSEAETIVGRQGVGTLFLSAGSTFHSKGNTLIGALAAPVNPAPGFVILQDADWISDHSIYVGGDEAGSQAGGGTIFLQDGSMIDNAMTMQVWSTGTVSMEGGNLRTHSLRFEEGSTLDLFAGTITVDRGQFNTPSTSLVFGGNDPDNPVNFEFVNGASAETTFAWHIGSAAGTHGATTISGIEDTNTAGIARSTLRGTAGGGGADLVVGLHGNGVLHVTDGALVDFGDDVIIGHDDDGVGVVNVHGVVDGLRATVAATRGGGGAALAVGGKHDGNGLSGGSGILNIHDGGLVQLSGDVFIGRRSASTGAIVVGGNEGGFDAELKVADDIFISGDAADGFGAGSLEIQDDGVVDVGDSVRLWREGSFSLVGGTLNTGNLIREAPASYVLQSGTIRIDGGELVMGGNNHSFGGPDELDPPTYEFANGALFHIPSSFKIGSAAGTFGRAIVDGMDDGVPSTIRNSNNHAGADIVVGELGHGALEVRNGGLIDAMDDFLVAGREGGSGVAIIHGVNNGVRSTVLADGRGINSSINIGANLVGEAGDGELEVLNGAFVSTTGDIALAHQVGSRANVRVDVAAAGFEATLHTSRNLYLGGTETELGGQAEILLGPGGLVDVEGVFRTWPDGYLDMDEGTLRVNHLDIANAVPGSVNFFLGRIEANQVTGELQNFAGTFAPGNSIADVTLDGNYTQFNSAELEIEIAGLSPGTGYDRLQVTGTADLDGRLRIIIDPQFSPELGQSFNVLNFGDRVGEFSEIFVVAEELVEFELEYIPTGLLLNVTTTSDVAGDFNDDGQAGYLDHALFVGCMTGPDHEGGPTAECQITDMDDDGDVDIADYNIFQFEFAGEEIQ